jgi:hypothetical protein
MGDHDYMNKEKADTGGNYKIKMKLITYLIRDN